MEVIEEIDTRLERGYLQQAAGKIEALAKEDISAAAYLMLLKRCDQLRRQTGSWELFREIARQGHRRYRGRNDLYALYLYALLRSGEAEQVVRLTGERPIEGERWQELREEIKLYIGDAAVEGQAPASDRRELFAILEQEKPGPFFQLYRRTGNRGFLLDALLLHAREGDIERAWELLQRERTLLREYPRLAFFLAIDAGEPSTAQQLLREREGLFEGAERLLLSMDLALRLGDMQAAEDIAYRLIREYPAASWLPYHNALYLQLRRGNGPDRQLLQPEEGLSEEERRAFLLATAELLIAHERSAEAQQLLRSGAEFSEESIEYQLILEKSGDTVNPERYKSLLRMLVNRDGGEKYAKHLAWFYLGIEDYSSLEELLDFYANSYGSPPWLSFYRGVLAYQHERHGAAMEAYRRSMEGIPYWESMYNAALAGARAGEVNAALNLLDKAELLCQAGEECDAIYFLRADIHLRHGQYAEARAALERGLELDSDDIDGRLLEDVLEERTE
jgi:hypothetical protein